MHPLGRSGQASSRRRGQALTSWGLGPFCPTCHWSSREDRRALALSSRVWPGSGEAWLSVPGFLPPPGAPGWAQPPPSSLGSPSVVTPQRALMSPPLGGDSVLAHTCCSQGWRACPGPDRRAHASPGPHAAREPCPSPAAARGALSRTPLRPRSCNPVPGDRFRGDGGRPRPRAPADSPGDIRSCRHGQGEPLAARAARMRPVCPLGQGSGALGWPRPGGRLRARGTAGAVFTFRPGDAAAPGPGANPAVGGGFGRGGAPQNRR